jgi:hypothetical protein
MCFSTTTEVEEDPSDNEQEKDDDTDEAADNRSYHAGCNGCAAALAFIGRRKV